MGRLRQRPRVAADLADRPRLKEALSRSLDRPLILVAAPAGFGKSTLLSAWLEILDRRHAWLSLDESDNDLRLFLAYFLTAMQSIFPDALAETRGWTNGRHLYCWVRPCSWPSRAAHSPLR
jgi:ATP/maltotriose-dependent transcriptional regulator MalT